MFVSKSSVLAIAVILCLNLSKVLAGDEEAACDCGPNSSGCKFVNGVKKCDCSYPYREENGICVAYCSGDYTCGYQGSCVNEKCECFPGTSGDFCRIIDECEGVKGPFKCGDPEIVLCAYDSVEQKPYCRCRIMENKYYAKNRTCIECDCGKHGSCSLVDGQKTCKCNEGAALKKFRFWGDIVDRCADCDCGEHSDGCTFDGLYTKICKCHEGYAQQPDLYGDKCNPCDCGPHGQCYFRGWYQSCKCEEGFKPFLNLSKTKLICKECDCGENGECSFEDEVKQCKCNPGYTEQDGTCRASS